ncbi:autotransporter domain-containing protein [Reyranella sp. CPCC 100927]|uniref:autotransporter domain-containing protein n=1 Tax=Reyranella sp. CPCC 100927 TaxID=2599616 RepID=UPI0015B63A3C|nr:autotransporter domain-containing protein [Reyranella sp. CPCC 100927]
MTSRSRHNHWRAALLASTALLAAPVVHAQTQWTGAVSNDWFTAGNWSTGAVPSAADNIILDRVTPHPTVIGALGARGTTLVVGDSGTGQLTIKDGGTLSLTGVGAQDSIAIIGFGSGATGTVAVTGVDSTWTNSGNVIIGLEGTGTLRIESGGKVSNTIGFVGGGLLQANPIPFSGVGTVTVSGAGSTWSNSGDLFVGLLGTGALRIENGGSVSSSSSSVGSAAGASGTATVSGAGSTWTNTIDLTIGDKGTGTLRIETGGTVSNTTGTIGESSAGAVGVVTVIGAGSTWTNSNNLIIGDKGIGTLHIANGGTVSNAIGRIGASVEPVGGIGVQGSGAVTVSGADSTWTNSGGLTVGAFGNGTLRIENGGTVSNTIGIIGASVAIISGTRTQGRGVVSVSGAGSTWTNSGALSVGLAGVGTLRIENGGAVISGAGAVGGEGGSNGTATVSGAVSTWTNSGDFTVGGRGTGTLNIETGGSVVNRSGSVGKEVLSNGTVSVSGAGSTWTSSDRLTIGGNGTGTLRIENGGTVSSFTALVGDSTGSSGTVRVNGAGSTWTNGVLVVGNFGTGVVTITDSAKVNAGTFVGLRAGSTGTITIGAGAGDPADAPGTLQAPSLTFGDGTGALAFNHTGTGYAFAPAILGKGTISHLAGSTVLNADSSAFTGSTFLSGGTLRVDGKLGGAVAVTTGGTLGGSGTVAGTVTIADGTLSAGASPGTLTVGSLSLGGAATSRFELNTPGVAGGSDPVTGNDLVAVAGNLILGGALDARTAAAGYYTLFTYGGTLTGAFASTAVTGTRGFAVTSHQVQTDIGGQVNLAVVGDRQALQFWDGADTAGNGVVDGGAGTWSAEGTNWTGQPGQAATNSNWGGSVAVFAGAAGGAVTVAGTQAFDTLQFSANGYTLGGGSLALSPATGVASTITVDGGVTATIATPLVGGSGDSLLKVGAGTLVLTGASTYERTAIDGGLLVVSGTLTNATITAGDLGAGALRIDTGGSVNSLSGIVGRETGANGGVIVSGAGSTWTNSGNLFVGDLGTGTLRVETGGAVSTMIGYVGHAAGANGTVTVNGAGSSWTNSLLVVGNRGTGTLRIENGGAVSNAVGFVGAQAGSSGTVVVSGAGSTWTSSEALTVGVGGKGVLTITDGAKINANAGIGVGRPDAGGDGDGAGGTGTINIGAGAGDPAAAPGTLQAPTLTFGAGTGTLVFNHTGDASFAPAITGTGTIRHVAGTTVLSADSSAFTGSTAVDGGILRVDGKLGGIVSVTGGMLGGSGTVGGVIAGSGSTVAPGNSIGTLNVAGNVSFAAGSTYAVEIEPGGAGDRLHATGTATLNGGTVSVVKAAGAYTAGTRYIILTADAGVSGTFAGLTQNLPFVDLALAYGPSSVFLDVTRNSTGFCDVAASRNQCAAARGVESLGGGNRLYDAIASLPDAAVAQRAFNALSGEIHASTRSALIEDSHYLRDAVVARTRLSGTSTAAGPQFAALAQATDQRQRPQDGTAVTAWFQGFGAIARTSGDGNAATAKRTTGGFFIGADTRIADTWTVGIATGYSRSTVDVDGRSSRATIDSYHLALYGGAQFGPVGVRLGASHTWHSIDSSRSITFPGLADAARADYKARTTQVFGDVGYTLALGDVALEPFANLAWVHLSTNRFGERGGIAALRTRTGSDSNLFSTLGIRAAAQVWNEDNKTLTLRGTLGWRHAFGDVTPAARLAFAGGTSFGVEGTPIARNAVVVEAGFDLKVGKAFTVGAGYSGVLASGARDHAFKGNLTYKF